MFDHRGGGKTSSSYDRLAVIPVGEAGCEKRSSFVNGIFRVSIVCSANKIEKGDLDPNAIADRVTGRATTSDLVSW